MLNYIWSGMIITGVAFAAITNRLDAVTNAIISSSASAVQLCIGLLGIMAAWTGIMKIAEVSGLIKTISKCLRPVMSLLFKNIPKDHPSIGAMIMNLVANFLGLGNAATPFGVKAMEDLQRLNQNKNTASDYMIIFFILNTSAIQLMPSTIIAIRAAAGSSSPADVVPAIWISTLCAATAGIITAKLIPICCRRRKAI